MRLGGLLLLIAASSCLCGAPPGLYEAWEPTSRDAGRGTVGGDGGSAGDAGAGPDAVDAGPGGLTLEWMAWIEGEWAAYEPSLAPDGDLVLPLSERVGGGVYVGPAGAEAFETAGAPLLRLGRDGTLKNVLQLVETEEPALVSHSIAVRADGSFVLGGVVRRHAVTFAAPGGDVDCGVEQPTSRYAFFAGYDNNGALNWASCLGGTSITVLELALATDGSVLAAGSLDGAAPFPPDGGDPLIDSSSEEAFLARVAPGGGVIWMAHSTTVDGVDAPYQRYAFLTSGPTSQPGLALNLGRGGGQWVSDNGEDPLGCEPNADGQTPVVQLRRFDPATGESVVDAEACGIATPVRPARLSDGAYFIYFYSDGTPTIGGVEVGSSARLAEVSPDGQPVWTLAPEGVAVDIWATGVAEVADGSLVALLMTRVGAHDPVPNQGVVRLGDLVAAPVATRGGWFLARIGRDGVPSALVPLVEHDSAGFSWGELLVDGQHVVVTGPVDGLRRLAGASSATLPEQANVVIRVRLP